MEQLALMLPILMAACDPGPSSATPTLDTAAPDTASAPSGSTQPGSTGLSCALPAGAWPVCDQSADDGICIQYTGSSFTESSVAEACVGTLSTSSCPTAQLVGHCVMRIPDHVNLDTSTFYYTVMPDAETVGEMSCDMMGKGGNESLWCPL